MTTRPGTRTNTQPIDAPDTLVGRTLDGRYRLDEVVSVGGMGIIFAATQLATRRKVAVKVLRPTLSADIDLATRFNQEIETVSRLSHPNIVKLLDCGQDASGLRYLAMEFVPGHTFREMLRACELTLVEILRVFSQVAEALIESHAAGIIHRDLKFENIMIRRLQDGRLHVTVLDFGVAKLLTRNESVTRSGEVPGTPGIIAPELVDQKGPSPQADLYSIGILMFTALSGSAPFKGDNDFEVMHAHRTQELPRLEGAVTGNVPEELIELVYELSQKDPKLRPRSAVALRDRIETIIASVEARHPDVPRYIPPSNVPIKPLDPLPEPADRSSTFLEDVAPEPTRQGAPVDVPVIAPTSVVGLLIAILVVVVVLLLYLVYRTFVLKGGP